VAVPMGQYLSAPPLTHMTVYKYKMSTNNATAESEIVAIWIL
jgi:hypothetical protein